METPNLALTELRQLVRELADQMKCTLRERDEKTERFCELFRNLDDWITHFRILPDDWQGPSRKHGIFDYTKSE